MTLYQVILKIDELNLFLEEFEKKLKGQKGKISLIKNLKSLLSYSVNILKGFKESEKIEGEFILTSTENPQGRTIKFSLQRTFVDKILRRTLISTGWSFFEDFFQKETKSKKIGHELLEEYFGGKNKIPPIIKCFRGSRNSMHSNGIYHGEKLICVIGSIDYKLENNQQVDLKYPLILDMIKESLNSL